MLSHPHLNYSLDVISPQGASPTAAAAAVLLQPVQAEAAGPLQLVPNLLSQFTPKAGVTPMPPNFMEDFASRHAEDGLERVMEPIGGPGPGHVAGWVSVLEDCMLPS
jgi:hypothetical protein